MSKDLYLIGEGTTEHLFANRVLAPYLALKGIYVHASVLPKKGESGGDVRFERVKLVVEGYLKQRLDTLVATFVDYYGIKSWPRLDQVRACDNLSPEQIAEQLNNAAIDSLSEDLSKYVVANRYFPFMAVHEFEALLFSDSGLLAEAIGIDRNCIDSVLNECGAPEKINNSPQTAPSKRLAKWSEGRFGKTTTGVVLAAKIGIDKMREQCPNFHAWLSRIEDSVRSS